MSTPPRTPARADAGFGLVEALVAGMVLMLFATGVYGVLTTTLGVSKVDRQRVAASGLAQREIEIARSLVTRPVATGATPGALTLVSSGTSVNPDPLPATGSSTVVAASPSVVDGVAYTVTRSATWAVRGTGTSSCDGGTRVSYPNVQLNVSVTWPGMRAVKPVVTSTVIAPPKNVLSTSYAFVAVAVKDYALAPVAGRAVTATGPSPQTQTTDSSGCAVFGLATAGAYSFTLNEPGWVDQAGSVSSTKPLTVTTGTFSSLAMTYTRSAALAVDLTAPTGYALPQTAVDASLYSTRLPTPGTRSAPSASSTASFTDVAPWSDGYVVYPGSCADANPIGAPTGATRPTSVLAAGSSTRVSAVLAPVRVQLSAVGVPPGGQTVTATSQSTCPTGQGTLTLGTTDATGLLLTSLPYGSWKVSAGGRTSLAFSPPGTGAVYPVTLT